MLNTLTSIFRQQPRDEARSYLRGAGKNQPPKTVAALAVDVVKAGGTWTARDLARHLTGGVDAKTIDYIQVYLLSAFKRGDVSRAEIHQRADQSRPSMVRYAADWRSL